MALKIPNENISPKLLKISLEIGRIFKNRNLIKINLDLFNNLKHFVVYKYLMGLRRLFCSALVFPLFFKY